MPVYREWYYSVTVDIKDSGVVDYNIYRERHDEEYPFVEELTELSRRGEHHRYTVQVLANSAEMALQKAVEEFRPTWADIFFEGDEGRGEAVNQPEGGDAGRGVQA